MAAKRGSSTTSKPRSRRRRTSSSASRSIQRELIGAKDAINLRIQIILAGTRLYQVFVVGPKDMVMGKEADAFLKSFEITR